MRRNILSLTLAAIIAATVNCNDHPSYERGLTQHFIDWLQDSPNRYEPENFNRTQFYGGSFGGKADEADTITKRPVIFIHGAADMLIGSTDMDDGFRHTIEHFLNKGYKKSELYGS